MPTSRIPQILRERGMSDNEFIAACLLAGNISAQTAQRLATGRTNVRLESWQIAARALGVGLEDLLEDDNNNGNH